jgi:hypothetical protein
MRWGEAPSAVLVRVQRSQNENDLDRRVKRCAAEGSVVLRTFLGNVLTDRGPEMRGFFCDSSQSSLHQGSQRDDSTALSTLVKRRQDTLPNRDRSSFCAIADLEFLQYPVHMVTNCELADPEGLADGLIGEPLG